jgi:hypothetical protein
MHETAAEIGTGLEPPLSPPVVGGAGVRAPVPAANGLGGLPSPPPAIRPPDAAHLDRAATALGQEPLAPSVRVEPAPPETGLPSIAPVEEELPTMAPPEETIEQRPAAAVDHFAVRPPVELEPVKPAEADAVELLVMAPPVTAPAAEDAAEAGVRVVVALQGGERVDIGLHEDFAAAMDGAREVIEELTAGAGNAWPFYGGRFIRPDAIVSVDLVEA